MREESHLDDMRSAIRGDFERLAERRGGQELMRQPDAEPDIEPGTDVPEPEPNEPISEAEPDAAAPEAAPDAEPLGGVEPDPIPESVSEPEPEPEPELAPESGSPDEASPRRSFFDRLLGR